MNPLFYRRTLWWPRWWAWLAMLLLVGAPFLLWWYKGESFLATTHRAPADVLVVEGWIGFQGVEFAQQEFERGGYRYIVTTGGQTTSRWTAERWNYAEEARKHLVRLGVSPDRIIVASNDDESQRTFHAALAVREALARRNAQAEAMNVITLGAHGRRSRLIFAKVMGSQTSVGVICWIPPEHASQAWWKSSERASDMIKETVGYLFEFLLNSGRMSNAEAGSDKL